MQRKNSVLQYQYIKQSVTAMLNKVYHLTYRGKVKLGHIAPPLYHRYNTMLKCHIERWPLHLICTVLPLT